MSRRPTHFPSTLADCHKLILELHAELATVELACDAPQLRQVVTNLASNAIEYNRPGGAVRVKLTGQGQEVVLTVADTGLGIAPEDLPHIFERFYRAEKSRTRGKSTGFGLGLSIAYWIVEKHGGRIEVDSKEGQGTTFCIWLPLISEQLSNISAQKN